jgi:DNA-binding IclR family transcriptional regulator
MSDEGINVYRPRRRLGASDAMPAAGEAAAGATRAARGQAPAEPEPRNREGVQVISRAASILRMLSTRTRGASLGDIAKAVGLPRSTVQRIVEALNAEGLLVSTTTSSSIRLGPGLLPLAAAAKFEIADLARPFLEELATATGETVDLAILDNDRAMFIDQVQGTHRLRAVSGVGVSFPLHASANGKAMLARLADPLVAKLRNRMKLTPNTPHTITSWKRLDQELAAIRETGLAYDREENSLGISAIGIAIGGDGMDLAAITIPVPTQRFAGMEKQLAGLLQDARVRLERRLGERVGR